MSQTHHPYSLPSDTPTLLLLSIAAKNVILDFIYLLLRSYFYFIFKFIYLFIYLLAALGLRCCMRAFSSCDEWGLLFIVVHGLLIVVASLFAEHGLWACGLQ